MWLWNLKMFFLIGGIFFKLGANILVEFEVFLIGAIFFNWGDFFQIGGKYVSGIWKKILIEGIIFL